VFFNRKKPVCNGDPGWDGQRFELDDPRVPEAIRYHAWTFKGCNAEWHFYFGATDRGGEWWLFDEFDEWVDGLWLES